MSWCTFLDPEVAHVGLSEVEARRTGIAIDTYRQPFAANDRARIDGQDVGFVKVHTDRGSGTILGATIVGARAGDLIAEIAVAMAGRVGLGALAGVVHPYPTYAEAIRRCGDDFNRARLTPRVARVLRWWASGR